MHHAPETLKKSGHKITPQRLAVWHLLAEGGHYTADELYRELTQRFPGIDRSTVYRTLELLSELRLVQETRFPDGPSYFEATDQLGHHHMKCKGCGNITHFSHGQLDKVLAEVARSGEFRGEDLEVHVTGYCLCCGEGK